MDDGVKKADESLREYSREELDSLGGVIDYAEKMIYRDGQHHPYASLRRSAYGKTVIIETEKKGRQCFRLSQTPAVITPNNCGYATPHSPVGRLCGYVRPGDSGESALWGEWEVSEIRLFDRFDGVHFEENVRNFLTMRVFGDAVKDSVTDLAAYLRQPTRAFPASPEEDEAEQLPAHVETATFVLADEEDDETIDLGEIDETEDEPELQTAAPAGYFGLNETFYVNRTREQDEIIARSPVGAMFVEGVAGSGKTSAALGRTKMLCDFDASNVASEAEFREVLGEDAAYWDGKFAGQFSQESSVGFVRTGELIQYLKETCRRIDLPNLPVLEYKELQTRLRDHRGLVAGGTGRSWAGAVNERTSTTDTTMAWLRAADAAMGRELAARLRAMLPQRDEVIAGFEDKYLPVAARVVDKALYDYAMALDELAHELERSEGAAFRLDRIVVRMHERLAKFRKEVLGKDVLWLFINERTYIGTRETDLAEQLIGEHAELYDRHGARLVWVDGNGPLDPRIAFVDVNGNALEWSEEVAGQLADGGAFVRDAEGRVVKGLATSLDDLYLRLLPTTSEKAYRNKEGTLVSLKVEQGLGRSRIPLKKEEVEEDPDLDEGEPGAEMAAAPRVVKKRSIDSRLRPLLRRRMLAPLRDMGGLYEAGLVNHATSFPDAGVAGEIRESLRVRKLTKSDIDLLLCLFQIAGRSYKAKPAQLSEPPFFQSVFIDEVQDFTEQQVFLMAEQARPEYRAVTVVGDLAQKLHNGTSIDVKACFPRGKLDYVKLSQNLRQAEAPGLALFSACFRAAAHEDGEIDSRVVDAAVTAGPAIVRPVQGVCPSDADLDRRILDELAKLGANQTAVVVFPTHGKAGETFNRLQAGLTERMINAEISSHVDLSKRFVRHFATIENTKGLEFDVVLLPMLEDYDLSTDLDRNRLYVGVSRAKQRLVLLSRHKELDPVLDKVVSNYRALLGAPAAKS
jgi:hypothetical protein